LQRELKKAHDATQGWIERYSRSQSDVLETTSQIERARRQLLVKEVEIGRLQGYIDRVLDDDRRNQGEAPKGPISDSLGRLRKDVIDGEVSLDEVSEDEIERLTGRDD
jgi:hypothetical protein